MFKYKWILHQDYHKKKKANLSIREVRKQSLLTYQKGEKGTLAGLQSKRKPKK